MGFELPDGKTARNLQDQVKFLSEKLKDLYAAFNDSGLKKIEIVDELPEVGDPTVLYLLAKEDPEEGDYYDEYLWYDNQWELIGSTQIDLSDYCTLSTDQTITGTKTIGDGSDNASPKVYFKDSYFTAGFRLQAYTFQLDSGLQLSGDVLPDTNGGKNIGSSSYYWSNIFLNGNIVLSNGSNAWQITNDSYNRITFDYGGTTRYYFQATEFFAPHIKPNANDTYDLGANGTAWKDLYLSGELKIYNTAGSTNSLLKTDEYGNLRIGVFNSYAFGFNFDEFWPITNDSKSLGNSSQKWKNLYLSGQIKDGNNSNYGLVLPNTTGWSANKTISTAVLKNHNIVCSNGTLVLIGNFESSINSQSSLGMAEASAVKMAWNNNIVLQIVNGTTIYYFDTSDSTIKTATIGTFTSDTITDY